MNTQTPISPVLDTLRAELASSGYHGEMETGEDICAVYATDNSIYEQRPQAVLFPRRGDDLNIIMRAADAANIAIAPRGGGTGTNGQSLTDQVVVDCSKYLTEIVAIDPETRTAIVQPGVILDQLNRAAAEYDLFFGPTVSTAAQATLGGMTATDASGKGSRVFGRMSDHILAMDVVLSDGSNFSTSPMDADELDQVCTRPDLVGKIHRTLRDITQRDRDEIERVFPVMNRGLTGYNLRDMSTAGGGLSLSRILAGSEGTLALTKTLTLRLLPKNPYKALMVIAYDDGLEALSDAARVTAVGPTAVEFIDDKILRLAQDDDVWNDIAPIVSTEDERPVLGLNFIEVQSLTERELERAIKELNALCTTNPSSVISAQLVREPHLMSQIWALRSKCVGLLGRMDPSRQGTPFVEDAAVPVENLRTFVAGFREILDRKGLAYGMFGHADVGCVHVRPALDMRRPDDATMIRTVSNEVEALARQCGGIIWGEHGKGYRGEYVPNVFGPRLYKTLCEVKAVFDPKNLLNPGKIASPIASQPLDRIDAIPFRGIKDAVIATEDLASFDKAIKCNGNGQCFNQSFDDLMCPSYKATKDRRFAPKGRAVLFREWLRLRSERDSAALHRAEDNLLHSLELCLSCKACSSRCPVKVDVPEMKSAFYHSLYQRRRRPVRHYVAAMMETLLPVMQRVPLLANIGLKLSTPLIYRLGLRDLPTIKSAPKPHKSQLSRGKSVLLVEDSFNASFDGAVIEAAEVLLIKLGYQVSRLPGVPNGKASSVLGFRNHFRKVAHNRYAKLNTRASNYDALIELEPAISSMANDEYQRLGLSCDKLVSIDRFLETELNNTSVRNASFPSPTLIAHCTERSKDPHVSLRWQAIFQSFGLSLNLHHTGCCGMAGLFGHERRNYAHSQALYQRHWEDVVEQTDALLATGFSCRSQVKRFGTKQAIHPVEYLAKILS